MGIHPHVVLLLPISIIAHFIIKVNTFCKLFYKKRGRRITTSTIAFTCYRFQFNLLIKVQSPLQENILPGDCDILSLPIGTYIHEISLQLGFIATMNTRGCSCCNLPIFYNPCCSMGQLGPPLVHWLIFELQIIKGSDNLSLKDLRQPTRIEKQNCLSTIYLRMQRKLTDLCAFAQRLGWSIAV